MLNIHHHKKLRFCISLFLLCSIMITVTVPANAYSTHSWKLSSKSASYTWGSNLQVSGSVIRNSWESAIGDWYSASSVNFYYSSASPNVLNSIYESSSSLYGRTTVSHSGGIVTSFKANINSGNSSISQTNVARSTANHEFGHVLGLDDLTSGTAIMNVNRNRKTVYVPKTDDKNGITAIYG